MRRLALAALLVCGCYDLDGLTSRFRADGGVGDGGVTVPSVHVWAGNLGGAGDAEGLPPTARFDWPGGLAVTEDGAIYLVDRHAATVMRIDPMTNAVTRVAGRPYHYGNTDGTGTDARFSGPQDLVAVGRTLYVVEADNNDVRRLDLDTAGTTATVSTIAGGQYGTTDGAGAAARFGVPTGIATDGTMLYVADQSTNRVRAVTLDGVVTTLAGDAGAYSYKDEVGVYAAFRSPTGLAFVSSTLLVLEKNNHMVRQLDLAASDHRVTTVVGRSTDSAAFARATCGALDGDPATDAQVCQPVDAVVDANNDVYVVDSYGADVVKLSRDALGAYSLATVAGTPISGGGNDGPTGSAHFNYPTGLGIDLKSRLLVGDSGNHTVRRVDLASKLVSTLAGVAGRTGGLNGAGQQATFNGPVGLATDGSALYVADRNNAQVRRLDASATTTTFLELDPACPVLAPSTVAAPAAPSAIAAAPDGTLYVADSNNGSIVRVSNGKQTILRPPTCPMSTTDFVPAGPLGLAVSGTSLYIADTGHNRILRMHLDAPSVVDTVDSSAIPAGCALRNGLAAPAGLALDATKQVLYVAARDNCLILTVDLGTQVASVLAGGTAGADDGPLAKSTFDGPTALALDGSTLYVGDTGNATLRSIALSAGTVHTVAGQHDEVGVLEGLGTAARTGRIGGLAVLPSVGLIASVPQESSLLVVK